MRVQDLRSARTVAVTELRAMGRRLTANRRRLLGVAVGLLQFAVFLPIVLYGPATGLGRATAAGDPPPGGLGLLCSAIVLGGLYMGAASGINQNRIGDIGPLVRTSVPPPAVTLGRLGSELLQTGVLFVPPLLVGLVFVGIGAGGPLVPLVLGTALAALLLAGMFVGRLAGAWLRYVGALSRLGSWAKLVVFAVVMGLVFAGSQVLIQRVLPGDASFLGGTGVPALLPGRPLQAYAAVALAPFGTTVRPVGLLMALAVLLAIPLGLTGAARVETALLFRERGGDGDESTTRDVPAPLAGRQSSRIAWRHLLRTARDPKTLAHVFPLVAGLIPGGFFLVAEPDAFLTVGPPLLVGTGAVLAGATYCLNPLGDDREQLPLVLTSVGSTAALLRGRVVAGSVIGLALAAVALVLAPFGPEPMATAAVVAVAPVVVAAAAGTALGIGAFSPQFERREYMTVERAHPSQLVLLGFMFGGGLLFGGATVGLWLALASALDGRLSPLLAGVAWVVTVAVFTALGLFGYGYAVSRFDGLTLESV